MTRRTIRIAASSSALALATALAAAPAAAQVASGSFQGSPTVTFGAATVTEGAGTTDVQVDSTSAVIDWAPDDTAMNSGVPIVFQPSGTTATFHNNPTSQNDFAVLNRIFPVDTTRPILFDGTVISRLQTAAGQVAGGTVFFYSPGGLIVGSNAVFDVGNLGLTSAPPVVDGNGFWYVNNTVQFAQAASGSFVDIQAGAQIIASAENSYFAAFAPRITQSGTINVNGQMALVAGEAGTITFSPDGLFNIQVTIGTDEPFAIDHTGTTGGPASSGAGDNHRIYMVAIPKNQAIQLAIGRGSQIGFDVAGAADIVGNAVVLSAGHNVTAGQAEASAAGGATADLSINDSNSFGTGTGIDFTSAVSGYASGRVFVDVFRQTNFASDALLQANDFVQVAVSQLTNEPAGALSVGGNLTLSAQRRAPLASSPTDAGNVSLFAFGGGSIDIAGDALLSAIATADGNGDGVAEGGNVTLQLADGSTMGVGGSLRADASAYADFDPSAPDATGGTASISLFGASSLTSGITRILSYGIAGTNNGIGGNGANGTGGFSGIFVAEGSSATVLELNVAADGVGGADTGAGAGDGTGGVAQLAVDGAGSTLTVQQPNQTGDFGLGEHDLLSAEGFGGATNGLGGTVGGTGTGGTASIFVTGGGSAMLPNTPTGPLVRVIARGTGGQALADGTTGGDGVGGNLNIVLDNGTLTVANLLPSLFGRGGSANLDGPGSADGGDGFGGSRSIHIVNGSTFTGSIIGGTSGGIGGDGFNAGAGGDGSGGFDSFVLDNSTLNTTGNFIVIGQTTGGNGRVGGNATSGNVNALITNGSTVNIAAGTELSFSSNAFGGTDTSGNGTIGGNATGGAVQVTVQGSTISGSGGFGAVAVGVAGAGGAQGGSGAGGTANVTVDTSTISVAEFGAIANGTGGDLLGNTNSAGGASGNGTGGTAGINLTGSTVNADIIDVRAEGIAGVVDATGFSALTGGTGTGGTAFFQALGGTTSVTTTNLHVDSQGSGGRLFAGSGTGGNGIGGAAFVRSGSGDFTITGSVEVGAEGGGGSAVDGGTGGNGTSGAADVTVNSGSMTINGSLAIDASSAGGDGTTGGVATFGAAPNQVVLNADNGTLALNGPVLLTANALGGAGTTGAGGAAAAGSVLTIAHNGGSIEFAFETDADAVATGGATVDGGGGAATGGRVNYTAQSGGAILLSNPNANLTADADAIGGSASGLGNGGSATAGEAVVHALGGTVAVTGNLGLGADAIGGGGVNGGDANGSTDSLVKVNAFLFAQNGGTITVDGTTALSSLIEGGFGSDGGAGGDATGGAVVILAQTNTASSLGSQITLNDVIAVNEALGGDGGSSTGTGGRGGDAVAGSVTVLGDAGNGRLVINGSAEFDSVGQGGFGGDGATGGAGGNGTGGFIQFGTRSGPSTSDNTGSASFADVTAIAAGIGGDGGAGSTGVGGDGGDGTNGAAGLLVRGSSVTVSGTAQLLAFGAGGNGGIGATTDGAGGDGIVGATGGIFVEATHRFQIPGDRGQLTAGSIIGQAFASGGTGSTPGASLVGDQAASFNFRGADGDIGSFDFDVFGSTVIAAVPDIISLTDATVNVGDFSFFTSNDLVLALDGAVLDTGTFFIQSRELVLPATAPVMAGTVIASNGLGIFVQSGASIRTFTNFETDFGVGFVVDGDFQTGDFTANGGIFIESLAGSVTTGDLLASDAIEVVAAQAVAVGNGSAGGYLALEAGTTVLAGNLIGGDTVEVEAVGNVAVGNISAGIVNPVAEGEYNATLVSLEGNVAAGNIEAANLIGVLAGGSASLGNLAATDLLALVGSNLTTGAIDAGNRVFIGDDSMISLGGPLDDGFDVELVFAADPTRTGGTVTIGGPVTAASFQSASSGQFSAGSIAAADFLSVDSGGLVVVSGAWTAPSIEVLSNDIDIASTGGIDAGSGSLFLVSNNFGGMFVGDGLAGSGGYRLSNAEFGRVSGGEILIAGVDTQEGSAGVSMTIGDLAISGNQLGGPQGTISFATGDLQTLTASGRIRVDGEIVATGMGPENYIEFFADSIEVNAETGGIFSTNASGGLGGIVLFEADNIHVASNEILLRLRDDPFYEGHVDDLNRAGGVDRPDGVLRALGLEFYPGQTLYIQNTGSASNPAGFYTTLENSDIEPPGFENPEAPDVKVIINGRFQTESGDVTGRDAFDLIVNNAESLEGISDDSQVNGCAFVGGSCTTPVVEEEAPPPVSSAEIEVLTEDQAEEEPFDTEEEEEAEQAASAPIAPPVVLINSSPLNPDVDIDDPVSGTGNPALIGASVTEGTQGDDQ